MIQSLNYAALSHFKNLENEGMLDHDNLSEKYSVHLKKLTFADGGEEDEINLFAWHFTKEGKEYLVPMQNDDSSMKDLDDILPLRVKGKPPLVAHGGKVYHLVDVQNYTVLKYNPERVYSFRELVDYLSSIPHENPSHKKLFTIMGLASYLDVCNYRVSTPPGFGKDSTVDTIGLLMGDASTVENPSIAKFEREIAVNKLVALNEITKIKKTDWDVIQMVLLACAAQKPSIKKRTRKFDGVGEDIDLTNLSTVLMYNDVTDYDDMSKYFDFVSDKNVIDRFPAFRFNGRLNYDFSKDDNVDFKRVARENQLSMRGIIKTLLYYKDDWSKEIKGFTYDLSSMSPRWQLNVSRILRYVDLYCETQDEFDRMTKLLLLSMEDYKAQTIYPSLYKSCMEKYGEKAFKSTLVKFINPEKTFITKVKLLDKYLRGEPLSKEEGILKWEKK